MHRQQGKLLALLPVGVMGRFTHSATLGCQLVASSPCDKARKHAVLEGCSRMLGERGS